MALMFFFFFCNSLPLIWAKNVWEYIKIWLSVEFYYRRQHRYMKFYADYEHSPTSVKFYRGVKNGDDSHQKENK